MRSLIRSAARLPGPFHLRRRSAESAFLGGDGGMFWGEFASAHEAMDFLPAASRSSYQDPDLLALNEEVFKEIHPFDWPVMFYLQKFMAERNITNLIDFGGHVGVKYHAFRELLGLKESFRWQVVETPAMAAWGRQKAAEQGLPNLLFFGDLQEADPSPILLCSGVLQYTAESLEELLAGLSWRPEIVILNKLPLIQGNSFYTLENFGEVKLPYRIFSSAEHEAVMKRLGYWSSAQWPIPHRDFSIPFSRPQKNVKLVGEVWLRGEEALNAKSPPCGGL